MPDKIIRSIPLITRYSRHNEDADWKFRAYLKSDCGLSNAELDAKVAVITERVWGQIDCSTCANCCRTLEITVNAEDIIRLAKHLNMPIASFKVKYVADSDDGTQVFHSPPCPFIQEDNRCGVYEARPKACRDYPYLSAPHFKSRSMSMVERCNECPIIFNVWQQLKEEVGKPKPRRK